MKIIGTPDSRLVTENNYHGVDVSLLISVPAGRLGSFKNTVKSFVDTCSNPRVVELIVKIDAEDGSFMFGECLSVLSKIPMRYKVVCYPRFGGYDSVYYFYDHLAQLADGHTIWATDVPIIKGDWLSLFSNARGIFDDNIYTINVVGNKISMNGLPAISVEWFRFFGCYLPIHSGDRFVRSLGHRIGRNIDDQTIVFRHVRGKRRRKIPKRLQKSLTEDFLVGYVDLFYKRHVK